MTAVTSECELRIDYTDGGHETVSEEVLLGIFAQMKKDLSKKRKTSGGTGRCVRRKLDMDT